jgi:hypothetical protein
MSQASQSTSALARYRPYILGAVFAAMLLYFGGEWVLDNLLQGPIDNAEQRRERLTQQKEKLEEDLQRAHQATEYLVRWESQSLPSDLESARSLYQAWLVELVEDVGLGSRSVNSGQPISRGGLFHTINFSVRGRGTLEQLTQFLFAFYRTDLLHQVRSLMIIPLSNSEQLDLTVSIEALVLPKAGPEASKGETAEARQETIFEDFRRRTYRESDRLASLSLTDYSPIVTRNLFGVGGDPNPVDYAVLTAITTVDGEPEAWFKLRATDKTLKLRQGDALQIDPVAGTIEIADSDVIIESDAKRWLLTIAEIAGSDVIIESDGERWLLTLGDRLVDAYALPPEF